MDSIDDTNLDMHEIDESPDTVPDLPTDSALDHELETEFQIGAAVDRLNNMTELNPEAWSTLDAQEKLDALQSVENTMADIQQRPPVTIAMESMDANVFGGFDPQTGGISVNADHLSSDMPVSECVNTIVHEGRHAYQDYAIRNPEVIDDPNIVATWAENAQAQNYLDPRLVGQEEYESQPIEADAFGYADRITDRLRGSY